MTEREQLDKKLNILWFSNAPWAKTGYGTQTRVFCGRLQKLGYRVTIGANYGLGGAPLNTFLDGEELQILPAGFTSHGNDIIGSHAKHAKADIVITLYDAWVYDTRITRTFRWCPWLPVDSDPLPEQTRLALQTAWQPIAYSQFGLRKLKEAGFDGRYVPHGIEMDVFKPMEKQQARKETKWSELGDPEFIAVMIAANKGTPSRKAFPETLWAWKQFVKDHPKSLLYLHTHAGPQMQGLDLRLLLTKLNMPDENIIFCDPYWNILGFPESHMAKIYSAADVLLSPSYGEGFGLPILEAQACGCPVVVNDCTSMSELCFAGWKTANQPFYIPTGAWQFAPIMKGASPSTLGILDALHLAYENKDNEDLRKQAREGALPYDVDAVTENYWKPVLAEIAEEIQAVSGGLEMAGVDVTGSG